MATGGEEQASYSLVKDRTVTLEDADEKPLYNSIVICQDKIIVVDILDNKVKIHRLHDGKFLGKLDSNSRPVGICLMNATTICVLHYDGLIEMASIKSEDMSPVFTRFPSFCLPFALDYCDSVVGVNNTFVVVGVKQDNMSFDIIPFGSGFCDRQKICNRQGWSHSYVTAKDNTIYISCLAGVDDTGVYGFDLSIPSQCKYEYKHKRLQYPTSIVINEEGNIFVGNGGDSCIHQLTASCQLVAIFTQGIPEDLQAMFWYDGRLCVTQLGSPNITVFRHVYQEESHKYSEFLTSHEKEQPIIVETSTEIEQGNVDKGQSSEEMETHPPVQIPIDYEADKQDTLTEDRICHLLSSESDLKAYISDDPPEACIKTLLSQASKLSGNESKTIIVDFILQQFREKFSENKVRVWAGEQVIGLENVQTVLVCFYSGSLDKSMKSFYSLKVIYRENDTVNGESAKARARERTKKSHLTLKHCDLINKAITSHGEGLFSEHSNLEAISSSGILSSNSRGLVPEPCVILYCRIKGIIPFGETRFPKRLEVSEDEGIAVDVREGYFSSGADSRNNDQENNLNHKSKQGTESLRMGSSVGPDGYPKRGTIGPFVKLNSDEIGFLTCAHVVCQDGELENITQTDITERTIVTPGNDSTASPDQNNHQVCGTVLNLMFRSDWSPPSSDEKFGIDAAVIKITSRAPDEGAFVKIDESQLKKAGFRPHKPLMFNTGKMKEYPIRVENIEMDVIKIGSASGLTKGCLQNTCGMVKYDIRKFERPNGQLQRNMHTLMEISSVKFSVHGDSGAGVFLVDTNNDNNLICIGLLVGSYKDGRGLAMPIDMVLTALHLEDLQITLKEF